MSFRLAGLIDDSIYTHSTIYPLPDVLFLTHLCRMIALYSYSLFFGLYCLSRLCSSPLPLPIKADEGLVWQQCPPRLSELLRLLAGLTFTIAIHSSLAGFVDRSSRNASDHGGEHRCR
jgi:hypothetical protein